MCWRGEGAETLSYSQQVHRALSIIGVGVLGMGTRKVGPKAFALVESLSPSPPKLQSKRASIHSMCSLLRGIPVQVEGEPVAVG